MIRVIIADDESLARKLLVKYLSDEEGYSVVAEAKDGFDLVQKVEEYNPDVILLDVQMPKLNGFEALELIKGDSRVIFTTAFDEFAIKAFEVNAVDYLQKPFSKERLMSALKKLQESPTSIDMELQPVSIDRVAVKSGREIKIIQQEEIEAIESADDYVILHSRSNQFVMKQTMKYFESGLDENKFFRIHRTAIVNIDFVSKLEPKGKETYLCYTKSGVRLNVSKSGFKNLKSRLAW